MRRGRTRQTTRDRVRKRKLPDERRRTTALADYRLALVGVTSVMTMMIFLYRAANSTGSTTGDQRPAAESTRCSTRVRAACSAIAYGDPAVSERFTVLVMGMDKRSGEEGFAYLTDTIMIVAWTRKHGASAC